MRFGWSPRDSSLRMRGIAKISTLLFIGAYTLIYWTEPFSDVWNAIVTNLFLVVASSVTAAVATKIWISYEKTDTPRQLWGYFSAGLWLWALAEVIWGYLNVTLGEVHEGIADVFWIGGYFFFAQALIIQYRILARPSTQELISRIVIALLSLLAVYLLILSLLISGADAQNYFDAAINSFYPAADLIIVVTALWLASNFMGGAFSRPWLGLLAFSIADLLYAWLEISGLYSWSINQANLLTTIFDIAYLSAYLVLGLGILSQWAFLKYGLRLLAEPA